MIDNVFIVSDASYSSQSRCVGIGVIDLQSGTKYSSVLYDINNSHEAEYRALLMSVHIAIKKGYNNVVFVYDDKGLNLETLKGWLADKIHSVQFLWLKRAYVEDADRLAKKARALHEKLINKKILKTSLTDAQILDRFKNYSQHKIIRAFCTIANRDEYQILKTYSDNKKYPPVLVESDSLEYFSDVYNLLVTKKNKNRFYKFIDKNYAGNIEKDAFTTPKSNEHYITIIKRVIEKLSYFKKQTKKSIQKNIKPLENKEPIREKLQKLKEKSFKQVRKFCVSRAKGDNKIFLNDYFNSNKPKNYFMNQESVEYLLFCHYILPEKHKESYFGCVKNKLKKTKQLKQLWVVRDEKFYLEMASKLL